MRPTRAQHQPIDSPANPTVRLLRDLHTAAGRAEQGAFLIEGTRLVDEAVRGGWTILAALYDAERVASDPSLSDLVERIPSARPATPRAIKQAAETVTPQGIIAAASLPALVNSIALDEPLVLVLDGLADPGNAGTLLRSAVGAGIRTVIALHGSVDLFSPKVVRAGMGAHFRLNLAVGLRWEEASSLFGTGRAVVMADSNAAVPYYQHDWRSPSALVIGSEAHGPSEETRKAAKGSVSIPIERALESLNAAVAGSVIMFEAKRQRDLAYGSGGSTPTRRGTKEIRRGQGRPRPHSGGHNAR